MQRRRDTEICRVEPRRVEGSSAHSLDVKAMGDVIIRPPKTSTSIFVYLGTANDEVPAYMPT